MRSEKEGSITVEAVFVIPIVLITIFFLIYLSFLLHDISEVKATIDRALLKASPAVKHEVNYETGEPYYDAINDRGVFWILLGNTHKIEDETERFMYQKLERKLFILRITKINAEVSKSRVSIKVETNLAISSKSVMNIFNRFTKRVYSGSLPVNNPAESLRISEVILETGDKVKGVEELKDKIGKIIGN